MTVARCRGLRKVYYPVGGGEVLALEGVDLEVGAGEFWALLGPSGCGKTTLLHILAGLDRAYEGEVEVRGRVGLVFQEPRLLPWLTVEENLRFVLDRPGPEMGARIRAWLARLGLEGQANRYPGELSLGMQQRVAVIRAFLLEPDLLLMDEPFSALDELTAQRLREELLELWAGQGAAVVFVTHNPLEAAYLADRVALMTSRPGHIAEVVDLRPLPRPRNPDDRRLWEISRELVRRLWQRGKVRGM
ncbi:ABC transporter ATP-binding protein [Thermus oshimai]|uniref:ABC transporter ATP-binding protein n=1 Tax=Thermus oshimai TaxID=56957 RepID=UPI0003657085|nr:ABC transporter ATP-binding protein [Thermus oshimai]